MIKNLPDGRMIDPAGIFSVKAVNIRTVYSGVSDVLIKYYYPCAKKYHANIQQDIIMILKRPVRF
jgi:hypothetical protein